jgi:putative spermidine/putrescine transport system permease protein
MIGVVTLGLGSFGLLFTVSFWPPKPPGIPSPGFTFQNYVNVFSNEVYRATLLRTVVATLLVLAIVAAVAIPVAYVLAKVFRAPRLKIVPLVILALPFFAGPLVRVIAITALLSRSGGVNTLLTTTGIVESPLSWLLFSNFAVITSLVYNNLGLMFFPVWLAFERVPDTEITAARDLGASRAQVFWRIIAPRAYIGLIAGMVLTIVSVSGAFLEPSFLGGGKGRLAADVVTSQFIVALNWALGSALAMAIVVAVALVVAGIVVGIRGLLWLSAGRGFAIGVSLGQSRLAARGRSALAPVGRFAIVALLPLLLLFILAPVALIVLFSFNESPYYGFPIAEWSIRWYEALVQSTPLLDAVKSSILVALGTALVSSAVAGSFAYGITRFKFRGRPGIVAIALAPLFLPTLVLGAALQVLIVWTDALSLGYASTIIGHVIYVVPFAILILWAWLGQVDWTIEEVAHDLGASYRQTLARVTLPIMWIGLRSVLILGFLLSFNEYNISVFLTRGFNTVTRYIAALGNFGIRPEVLAYSTILILIVFVVTFLISPVVRAILKRSGRAAALG